MAKKNVTAAKKLVKQLNKETDKVNAAFEKLKPAEKRVYIARDVLAQLDIGKLRAESGTWVKQALTSADAKNNRELKDVFDDLKTCNACALGGLFVCAVRIADKLKFNDLDHVKTGTCALNIDDNDSEPSSKGQNNFTIWFNDVEKYLKQFFSNKQLRLIELAFEEGEGGVNRSGKDEMEDVASDFFSCQNYHDDIYLSDEDKMRLVMQNIIVNRGTFRPDKTLELTVRVSGFKG